MYQLAHENEMRRLIHLLSDFEENDAGLQLLLFIGNGDYTDYLEEGNVSVAEDSPTILADLTLSTRPKTALENAPVALKADIDGIVVPLLSGTTSAPVPQEDYSTHLIAASSGSLLNRVRMVPSNSGRHITEYFSWTPERVIRDAVGRCTGVGGYDAGQVYIQRLGAPLIRYVDNEGFSDDSKCWDALSKLKDSLALLYRDTPDNGFESLRDPLNSVGDPVAWNFETTTTQVMKWVPPVVKSPDEQYTDVLVRRREDDGHYSAIGYASVDYWRTGYPPHADQTLVIDYTDPADGDAAARARRMAFDHARLLSRGVYKLDCVVSFNPLLQKGDVVRFLEDYVDEKGRWRRLWQGVIKTWKHAFKEGIETDLSLECFLVEETLLDPPSTAGKKTGKVSLGVMPPLFGPLYPRRGLYPRVGLYPRT